MQEQYITYETAVLAKEAGFDLEVNRYYNYEKVFCGSNSYFNFNKPHATYKWLSAPTQALLAQWLRVKHNINVEPCIITNAAGIYWQVFCMWFHKDIDPGKCRCKSIDCKCSVCSEGIARFDDPEQALEHGLQAALLHILNK